MNKFYDDLKSVLINNSVRQGHGYFETIKQNEEKMLELISDYESYDMYFSYRPDDDGYSEGTLSVWFKEQTKEKNYTYYINLLYDERNWGYCRCTSDNDGYNPVKGCCGNGCDWTAPRIDVNKTIRMVYESFNGIERDLWKLEPEWKQEVAVSKHDEIEANIQWFDLQIAEIQKRKEMYLQETIK